MLERKHAVRGVSRSNVHVLFQKAFVLVTRCSVAAPSGWEGATLLWCNWDAFLIAGFKGGAAVMVGVGTAFVNLGCLRGYWLLDMIMGGIAARLHHSTARVGFSTSFPSGPGRVLGAWRVSPEQLLLRPMAAF